MDYEEHGVTTAIVMECLRLASDFYREKAVSHEHALAFAGEMIALAFGALYEEDKTPTLKVFPGGKG